MYTVASGQSVSGLPVGNGDALVIQADVRPSPPH